MYLKALSLDPLFSIVFLMIFYYFIKNANINIFADDNTLTTFAHNVQTLILVLESESNIAIDWFGTNKAIVNPGDGKLNLDDKLNFNLHITNIYRSAANQLNALIRL